MKATNHQRNRNILLINILTNVSVDVFYTIRLRSHIYLSKSSKRPFWLSHKQEDAFTTAGIWLHRWRAGLQLPRLCYKMTVSHNLVTNFYAGLTNW